MAIVVFSILTAQPSSLLSCRILCIARKERSTSSGSLIILMKKKFYRLSVRRYSLTNIYAVVERERERKKTLQKASSDSSSVAVARPTTSVNYYLLYYKRRIGKNCDKQTNDYEQFRSQPLLIGQLAREKEFSVVRRRKKAEREHKKGFSLLSLLSM